MTDSREARRATRRHEIQEHACRLVVERGLDGFTMDDLAAEVGVSRRTLFNHVPDKVSAVLGEGTGRVEPRGLAEFMAGGPTRELVPDGLQLLRSALAEAESQIPDAPRRALLVERAVAADPKVALALRQRTECGFAQVVDAVCTREGWPAGDLRARVLTAGVVAVVFLVLDEVVRRGGKGSFREVFDEVVAASTDLGAPAGGAAP